MIKDIWDVIRGIVLIVLFVIGLLITGIFHLVFFPIGLVFQLKPEFSFKIDKI